MIRLMPAVCKRKRTSTPVGPSTYEVSQIASLEHDTTQGIQNSVCLIDATHLILAYVDGSSKPCVKSFALNASYGISQANALEHSTVEGWTNSVIAIDATHFILAYRDSTNSYGYIKTFAINSSYVITELHSLQFTTVCYSNYNIIMLDSTHFAVVYLGVDIDGFVSTFSIDGSYNISLLNTLEYDTTNGQLASMCKIDSTHFAIANRDDSYYEGYVRTFSVDGSYAITQVSKAKFSYVSKISYASIILLDASHLAIAYTGGSAGYLRIVSFNASYVLSVVSHLQHAASYYNNGHNCLAKIDDTHFALAFAGESDDGYIKTFGVDGSYNMTEIDSLEHDTANGTFNSLILLDATHLALAYAGERDDGYVKTFLIS